MAACGDGVRKHGAWQKERKKERGREIGEERGEEGGASGRMTCLSLPGHTCFPQGSPETAMNNACITGTPRILSIWHKHNAHVTVKQAEQPKEHPVQS